MRIFAAVALASGLVMGCGGRDGGGGDGDGDDDAETQACLDTADAVAGAAERCGGDYQANYDAFIDGAAEGDCSNIVEVRDAGELYDECFPSLEAIACEDLLAGDLDASCREQLLRMP
jgi:hypothetical protein